jgi:hypothetical protein
MLKLSSINELKELRSVLFSNTDENKPRIVICAGTACHASGSNGIIRIVKKYIIEKKMVGNEETVDYPWLAEPDEEALSNLMQLVINYQEEAKIKGSLAREFIQAEVAIGASHLRIISRHLIPTPLARYWSMLPWALPEQYFWSQD